MRMNEITRIEIPDYIRYVKLSERRQAKYYELGKKKLPEKYNNEKYQYRAYYIGKSKKMYLTNVETGEKVVVNPKSQGTPKFFLINGQGIYDQTIIKQQRAIVMEAIKESFYKYIESIPFIGIDKPIRIYAEIHDYPLSENGKAWDVDNRFYMYQKAFQDCLTGNRGKCSKKIKDDSNLYITQPPSPLFIPIEKEEQRKLVFIICEETDERILNSQLFKHLRNADKY